MRAKKTALLLAVTSICAGCAADVYLTPSGGSRSAGTITMTTELGALRDPKFHFDDALQQAAQKCKAWGYSGAEAFGSVARRCVDTDPNMGCVTYRYSVEYQCTTPSGIK
jgi:hypothetical protein